MGTETLKVLESKIEELLVQHEAACEERERLREALDAALARSAELADQLKELDRERADVKERVERILGRLDGLGLS